MAGAARRLDVAIAQASTAASPTICGPLHEARARVALLASEWSVFERHRLEVESWFKPTRNPVLIARVQQLIDAGRPQSRRSIDQRVVGADAVTIPDRHQNHGVSSALSACRGRSERAQQVLDFLIHAASGRAGYLYLAGEGSALELAAPAFGEEPPDELALAAHAAFDGSGDGDERAAETVVEGRRTRRSSAHRVIVLATAVDSQPVVIGAVVVVEGAVRLTEPSPALVSDLARALLEAGDAAPRVQG
jgi:hypothetical protein